jgi:hypothetical protein
MSLRWLRFTVVSLGAVWLVTVAAGDTAAPAHDTYSDDEVAQAASDFFSSGAKDLSDVLAKVLKDKGRAVRLAWGSAMAEANLFTRAARDTRSIGRGRPLASMSRPCDLAWGGARASR